MFKKFKKVIFSFMVMLPVLSFAAGSEALVPKFKFNSLLVFGDSYSDIGAGYANAIRLGIFPQPNPQYYFEHHFCNGPNWSENLANHYLIKLQNYAVGGATLGTANLMDASGTPNGGIKNEIQRFEQDHGTVKKKELTVLFGGINDIVLAFFENGFSLPPPVIEATVKTMSKEITERIGTLQNLGAENIIVWNLFDGTRSPIFFDGPLAGHQAEFLAAITAFNKALVTVVADINLANPSKRVFLFDTLTSFNKTLSELSASGIVLTEHVLTETPTVPISAIQTMVPLSYNVAWYDDSHPSEKTWLAFYPKFARFIEDVAGLEATPCPIAKM